MRIKLKVIRYDENRELGKFVKFVFKTKKLKFFTLGTIKMFSIIRSRHSDHSSVESSLSPLFRITKTHIITAVAAMSRLAARSRLCYW